MKQMKSAVCLLLAAALAALPACGAGTESGRTGDKSLYERGLDMIALMQEMAASDEYIALMSSSEEFKDVLSTAAQGDVSHPQAVYRIKVLGNSFFDLAGADIDGLSEALRDNLESKLNAAIFTQINAQGGSMALAAASICTVGATFVSDELTEDVVYLYTFEDAAPAAVTFGKGEGGAVSATGMFILYDGFRPKDEADLRQMLVGIDIQVEEVET